LEYAHGQRDVLDVVALVIVQAPVHHRDGSSLERSDDELTGVARRGAAVPAGDRRVRDAIGALHVVRERAEPAAEHDRDDRLVLRLGSDRLDGRLRVAHVPGSFRIFSRSSERNGRACDVRTNFATVSERRTAIRSPAPRSCSSWPSIEMRAPSRTATWIDRTAAPRATTTSFSARKGVSRPARTRRASSNVRSSTLWRPTKTSAIAESRSSIVIVVRKPRRPRFTPRSGMPSGD